MVNKYENILSHFSNIEMKEKIPPMGEPLQKISRRKGDEVVYLLPCVPFCRIISSWLSP